MKNAGNGNDKSRMADIGLLLLIFTIGVAVHYAIGSYIKTILVYPDELRYVSIARSIAQGMGITIRGATTDFQKVGYALVLAPLYGIGDQILRIRLIALVNSILMISSIVPVWLIGREIGLSRPARFAAVILTAIWPDMMYSQSFMSEILYWPLVLWYLYLCLKLHRTERLSDAVLCGIVLTIGYLTKEIFLALPIATLIVDVICLWRAKEKRKLIMRLIPVGVFACIFIILKLTVFRGLGNSYNQQSIDVLANPHNILYMIYAFLYYLAAIIVASYVIPMILPAVRFGKMNKAVRILYGYGLLFLVTASAVIAYTISVREDLDQMTPHLHMRYLGPGIIILLVVMVSIIAEHSGMSETDTTEVLTGAENGEGEFGSGVTATRESGPAKLGRMRIAAAALVGLCTIFVLSLMRHLPIGNFIDELTLEHYRLMLNILPGNLTAPILLIIWTVTGVVLLCRAPKAGRIYFLLSVLAGCIICNISARSLKMWYSQDEAVVNNVIAISEYLDGADESGAGSNVLYLVDGAGEFKLDETTDTYMDHIRNFCYVDSSFILGLDPGKKLVVSDTEIRERNLDGLYTDLESIDYYVIENTIDPASYNLDNVEPVPELSQGFYTVYRNTDPTTIAVK